MRKFRQDRQEFILSILEKENRVVASELSVRLQVSEDTIRRDLNELDKKGLLKRVHSGAVKNSPEVVDFSKRGDRNLEEKIRLAKKAVTLIKPDSVVMLDGGTTNYQLIKQIPKTMRCTVITNSTPLLDVLKDYPNIKIVLLGGDFSKEAMVSGGPEMIRQVERMRPDLYFMGIPNIDKNIGITISLLDECYTKQTMLKVANNTAVLVTKEKIGTSSQYVICSTDEVSYIITEDWDETEAEDI